MSDEEENAPQQDHKSEDNESGIKAWLCVMGSSLFLASSFGFMQSIGTIQAYLSLHQLASYTVRDIGWITGTYTFLALLFGVQIGPWIDSYGSKIFAPTAAVLNVLMFILLAECRQYWHFMLCLGILGGIAAAFASMVAITSIGKLFVKRKGLAMGIALSGSSFGGVIFPLMLREILPSLGWAWSCRVLALLICGFMAIGTASLLTVYRIDVFKNRNSDRSLRHAALNFVAFRSGSFSAITVGTFLLEFAMFGISGLLPLFAETIGMSASAGYSLVAILNGCSCLGRVLPGMAGDKYGHFDVFLLMTLSTAVMTGALFVPFATKTPKILYAFSALWGFGSGSFLSIMPVCIGKTCDPKDYGRYYGTMTFVVSFSPLISIPIGGQLLAAVGLTAAAGLYLAAVVAGGIFFYLARSLLCGKLLVLRARI